MLAEPAGKLAESSRSGADRALEATQLGFVEIPPVDEDGIGIGHRGEEFLRRKTLAGQLVRVDVLLARESEGDDLLPEFNRELRKDVASAGSTLNTISAVSGSARIASM